MSLASLSYGEAMGARGNVNQKAGVSAKQSGQGVANEFSIKPLSKDQIQMNDNHMEQI